jgi:DNA replication protein DnaC
MMTTTNLEFSQWPQVFGSEQLTDALLDRLTHYAHILTMNGESFRFRESIGKKRG